MVLKMLINEKTEGKQFRDSVPLKSCYHLQR
jgi:hypothetical protein